MEFGLQITPNKTDEEVLLTSGTKVGKKRLGIAEEDNTTVDIWVCAIRV